VRCGVQVAASGVNCGAKIARRRSARWALDPSEGCPPVNKSDDWQRGLRSRRERPRGRAAEQRYEFASLHSITSSASASSPGGIVKLSVLAVFRLMRNSNLDGNSIGSSPGLAPLRMRPAYTPARR
jgi:hypothetical protein